MKKIDYKLYEKPSDFIRFKVGENRVVIVSAGGMSKKHGMKTATSYIPMGDCTETPDCPQCLKGNEAKLKWSWIVFIPTTRSVRVMDVGPSIGNAICLQAQERGIDPLFHEVLIHREGNGISTKYETSIGQAVKLSEDDLKFITPAKTFLVKKYFGG